MAVESNTVTGLFNDRDSAERAYQSASERGYDKSDVNLVMSDETRKKHFTSVGGRETELGNKAAEGAGIGGAVGGTLGAIAAAVAAASTSLVIPGLGLVIAGPIAGALAGASAGGVTGGLVGALIGWGIPEERSSTMRKASRKAASSWGSEHAQPRTLDISSNNGLTPAASTYTPARRYLNKPVIRYK